MTFNRTLSIASATAVIALVSLTPSASADKIVKQNVAFHAKKVSPYNGNAAFEFQGGRNVYRQPLEGTKPLINFNPTGGPLESLLGVDLPSLIRLKIGAGVWGSNNVDFGYYVTGGRLDMSYPASSQLSFEQGGPGEFVRPGHSFTIGSTFVPGIAERIVSAPDWGNFGPGAADLWLLKRQTGEGGLVYYAPAPPIVSTPSFAVSSPYAEAWLDTSVDVNAGAYVNVEILGGLISYKKTAGIGRQIGGRLAEVNLTGAYVAGKQVQSFVPDRPFEFSIPQFGKATLQVPDLAAAGAPASPGSAVLVANEEKEILKLDGNLERFIPLVGPLLNNGFGPFRYTLFHVGGGPKVSMYQQMSFTPDPKLKLDFSEPVVLHEAGGTRIGTSTQYALGQPFEWEPMFSDSTTVTVAPSYILDNKFRNETGLKLSIEAEVEALKLAMPGFPDFLPGDGTLGPVFEKKLNIPIAEQELFSHEFAIPFANVTSQWVTHQKSNLDIRVGFGNVKFDTYVNPQFHPDGSTTADLLFKQPIDGGGFRNLTAHGVTFRDATTQWGEGEGESYTTFTADADIVLTDDVTSELFNIGRYILNGDYDFLDKLPDEAGALPAVAGVHDALYMADLPLGPDLTVDVNANPYLGAYNGLSVDFEDMQDHQGDTETTDRRVGGFTTVIARTGESTPVFDGTFTALPLHALTVDGAGNVLFSGDATQFGDDHLFKAIYRSDGETTAELLHSEDPAPDGNGVVDFGEIVQYRANEQGQYAFGNVSGVFRDGPGGYKRLAAVGAAAPDGSGAFTHLSAAAINEGGQVAVYGEVLATAPLNPLNPYEHGVYRMDGNTSVKIARDGDALPGIATRSRIISEPAISDSGTVLFGADGRNASNLGVVGLFVGDGGAATKIVTSDDVSPSGLRYQNGFYDYEINASDQVAFVAALENAPPSDPPLGVYRWDNGHVDEIAVENTTLRQDGTPMFGIGGLQLNNAGDVAFTERRGVYMYQNEELEALAYNGLPLADGSGTVEPEGFGSPILNERGQVAFDAGVFINAEQAFHDSIFVHDGERLVEVARSGQALAGSVIQNLYVADMNDRMQVVYYAELADSRQVVVRFDPALYWKAPGSGQWETDGNWSLGIDPAASYDANIIAEQPLTVMGPAVDSAVRSLVLGGEQTAEAVLDLVEGTTLTIAEGARVRASGVLRGKGTIDGDVVNEGGTVSPGASPGTLHIDGDYLQGPLGKLALEIAGPNAGTEYDVLDVTGDVLLAGEVEVALVAGYIPAPGTRFNLVAYDGTFDASQAEFRVTGAPAGTQFAAFAANGVFGIVAGVPEPCGLALACLSCVAAIGRRRRV